MVRLLVFTSSTRVVEIFPVGITRSTVIQKRGRPYIVEGKLSIIAAYNMYVYFVYCYFIILPTLFNVFITRNVDLIFSYFIYTNIYPFVSLCFVYRIAYCLANEIFWHCFDIIDALVWMNIAVLKKKKHVLLSPRTTISFQVKYWTITVKYSIKVITIFPSTTIKGWSIIIL